MSGATERYDSESDDKVMAELHAQEITGLTPRGRLALVSISDSYESGDSIAGEVIFLLLSMNSRIRELEKHVHHLEVNTNFNGEVH